MWKLIARGGAALFLSLLLLGIPAREAAAWSSVTGHWTTLPSLMPINPVHAALLLNGQVLLVAGSGNCPPKQQGCPTGLDNPPYGPPLDGTNGSGAALYAPGAGGDYTNGTYTQLSLSWDMFCNGMVLLPDGRALIVGGTIQYDPFHGSSNAAIFDPSTNTFTNTATTMSHGRWYPTVVTLADGRAMTFGGLTETGLDNNRVEIYDPVKNVWGAPRASWSPPNYPWLHLLPTGKVFFSGRTSASALFNTSTQAWSMNVATTLAFPVGTTGSSTANRRDYGTSVLLPLLPSNDPTQNYRAKVMIMGGYSPATNTTEIIDFGVTPLAWQFGPPMSQPRTQMNAVILPTGTVLALGGSLNNEGTKSASLNADLYNPLTNTFSSAGANAFPRLYHSVALLLPDATVWVAGSNPARGKYEQHVEIYQPAYLFNPDGTLATRPSISSVTPASISCSSPGTSFPAVQSPDAANIASVVLVRNGAVTHSFNMDQRLIGLSFSAGSGVLNVTAWPSCGIAPPGYYMLFLVNTSGVPSVAASFQVTP